MKRDQPLLFDEKLLPVEADKLKATIRKRIAKLKRRQLLSKAEVQAMGAEAIQRVADVLGGPKFEGTPTPGLVVTLCDRKEM